MTPVDGIINAIRGAGFQVEDRHGEYRCQCPSHGTRDSDCNLSVKTDDRGAAVLKCYSSPTCTTESILQAIGLTKRHLFADAWAATNGHPHTNGPTNGKPIRTGFPTPEAAVRWLELKRDTGHAALWFYHLPNGTEAGAAVRFDKTDGDKEVIPLRKEADGWHIGGMPQPHPLYGLPKLADAGLVLVCEGEKCCAAAESLGLVATTSPGGSKAAAKADWAPLAGKTVCILPDNDAPGEGYCRDVLRALAKLDPRPAVKIVRLPGLPDAGDLVDFIEASRSQGFRDEQIADFVRLKVEEAEEAEDPQDAPKKEPPKLFTLPRITSAELAAGDYRIEYLVERTVVAGQPAILAGGFKTLKTSIVLDLAISLASGGFFLGKLPVLRQCRVGVLTGESGLATIQETCLRICRAAGCELADLPIIWSDRLPKFYDLTHRVALTDWLKADGLEVCILDPAYLSMPSKDAGNIMAQGELLREMGDACQEAGAMPIICHHTKRSIVNPLEPPELGDIAWSGFAEWARQWILVGRRERYEPGTGFHRLWCNVGGSAGHSALWAVDVNEGPSDSPESRYWDVTVQHADEARQHATERASEAKAQAAAEKKAAELEADVKRLCELLAKGPDSKTSLRDRAAWNSRRIASAVAAALDREVIRPCRFTKNSREEDGFELTS